MTQQTSTMRFLYLSVSLCACLSSCKKNDVGGTALSSNSNIPYPTYDSIIEGLRSVSKDYPKLATTHEYGKSMGGEPLVVLKIRDSSIGSKPNAPAVVITEAVHGEEYLNITDRLTLSFLRNMTKGVHEFLGAGGVIYMVPVQNPDGFKLKRRENNNGADLNRDYIVKALNKPLGFDQVETSSWHTYLDNEIKTNNLRLAVAMDYHCCSVGIIHPWGVRLYSGANSAPMPQTALETFDNISKSISTRFQSRYGDVLDICNYQALGISADHYYETYGAASFVFEGTQTYERDNLDSHVAMWDQLFTNAMVIVQEGGLAMPPSSGEGEKAIALLIAGIKGAESIVIGAAQAVNSVSVCNDAADVCSANPNKYSALPTMTLKQVKNRALFIVSGFASNLDLSKPITFQAQGGQTSITRTINLTKKR